MLHGCGAISRAFPIAWLTNLFVVFGHSAMPVKMQEALQIEILWLLRGCTTNYRCYISLLLKCTRAQAVTGTQIKFQRKRREGRSIIHNTFRNAVICAEGKKERDGNRFPKDHV